MNRFLPILPIVLVLATLTVLSACEEDDDHDHDHGHIDVTFLEPMAGSTVADCSDVHIHVRAEAEEGGEVHDIEVELYRLPDDSLIWSYDQHAHVQVADIEQDLDLCGFAAGTCFELEVEVEEDHDSSESEEYEIEFCI